MAGSGTDYKATITPPANAAGSIDLTVKADAATDGVRNGPTTDASVAIDFDTVYTAPLVIPPATIVFSEPSGTQLANTFDVGITFSKSVTGFEAGDLTLTTTRTTGTGNASLTLSGSGTDYTGTITSPTDAKGSVILTIAANAANDGANNVPAASQASESIAFDTTVPTVSLTAPQDVQSSAFDVGITFSKSVTGFEVGDITLTTSHTSGTSGTDNATFTLAGSGTDYTATITPPADAAGNVLTDTFDIGITFSKPVTGFETEDIVLITTPDDGSVSSVLTGSGTDYTATITVPAETKGTVQVQIPVDAVK